MFDRGKSLARLEAGDGAKAVRAVLEQFQPRPDALVTLIQVTVTGSGVVHTLGDFGVL